MTKEELIDAIDAFYQDEPENEETVSALEEIAEYASGRATALKASL